MKLNENFKNILTILALAFSLASIIATSKKGTSRSNDISKPKMGSANDLFQAQVSENCSQPQTTQENVVIQHFQVVAPEGKSFMDLGFPSDVIDGVNSVNGIYGSYIRYCEVVIGGPSPENEWLYTCSDQAQASCFIKIKFNGSYPPPPADNSADSLKEPKDLKGPE